MPAVQNTFKAELRQAPSPSMRAHASPATLREPTTGWTVRLERAVPQGISPKDLLLKLIEVKPTGAAGDIVTTHHVRYDEEPAEVEYTEVTIEGAFSITVHHVVHA